MTLCVCDSCHCCLLMTLFLWYMIFDFALLLPAAVKSSRDSRSHLKITYTKMITNIGLSELNRLSAAARPARGRRTVMTVITVMHGDYNRHNISGEHNQWRLLPSCHCTWWRSIPSWHPNVWRLLPSWHLTWWRLLPSYNALVLVRYVDAMIDVSWYGLVPLMSCPGMRRKTGPDKDSGQSLGQSAGTRPGTVTRDKDSGQGLGTRTWDKDWDKDFCQMQMPTEYNFI